MHELAFLVYPSFTPPKGRISGTSIKIVKGCRDGKPAKTSATRNYLYDAVVVNDHMHPHPYIVSGPKGVIET